MKKIYQFALALSLICSTIHSASSQHTFADKKKSNVSVDVSSLNARKISRPKNLSNGRVGQHPLSNSRTLVFPQKDLGHRVLLQSEGRPAFIRSDQGRSTGASVRKNINEAGYDYLRELSSLLKLKDDVTSNFVVQRIQYDKRNGSHIRMQQMYKGVPVHGAEVIVHLNAYGEGEAFNGKYILPEEEINIVPALGPDAAVGKVKGDATSSAARALTAVEKKLVQYGEPEATLCIYEDKSLMTSHVLAYRVIYSPSIHKRLEYFIDAQTGNVLKQINTVCFADGPKTTTATDLNGISHTVHTYQVGTNYFMLDGSRAMFNSVASVLPDEPVGGIITVDMNNTFGDAASILHMTTTNNVWNTGNHAKAVSAHFNAGAAYEYFLNNHGRSSINGKGGTMISVINVTDPETGEALDNAFWNGKAMFYGNGNTELKPLSGGLDAAGHEMTHGVIENTANLDYEGESGAINESMADIFGSMMDPDDWKIGEDVVKLTAFPSGALRSLEDPHNGGTVLGHPGFQPKHMNEKYLGTADNGGVHINSGIPNHAFYRYAEAISREKAAAVYYKALDEYLTKSSQFIDLRLAVIAAAEDLFGATSTEATQAGIAFDAVGITDGEGGDYQEELPENPGTEYLLVYNTFEGDQNTLYRSAVGSNSATPLTTTAFASRPSVTDDGTYAVFVAEDRTIHSIVTAPGEDPDEFVIQDEAIWSNVAISKDGNRLAAVTEDADNIIYVYDFDSESWAEFELYNPTYSDGINAGGTEFADALEWDYTGQFVVYDAFNSIQNAEGNDIEYWDVNFMQVWDIETKDFGDGTILKLFSSLPEGVSIGNPTFAKLSPSILAFDMVDEINDEYYIVGANIETGETDIIYTNGTLGFPSFNKTDTRVAFTMEAGSEGFYTGYVNLNPDKISSPDEEATDLFDETQWAVYFAAGDRDIGDDGDVTGIPEQTTVKLTCYPNPFVSEIALELTSDFVESGRVQILDALGHQLDAAASSQTDGTLTLGFGSLPAGQYVVRIQQGNKIGMCRAVKMH
jgi:Zn-dependent metalloprotease